MACCSIPASSQISMGTGVAIGIGTLVVGWLVYDLLWTSPLGRFPVVSGTICYVLVVALAYGLTHLLSGRAAYIHIGALFGTIMTANVWVRILPASRNMLNAVKQGRKPDMTLGARAKASHHPQHLHDHPADLPHGQQSLSRHVRQQLQLADSFRADSRGRHRRQAHLLRA